MQQFTVNDTVYNLPTSWSEVNLEQFIRISAMKDMQEMLDIPELGSIYMLEVLTNSLPGEMDDVTINQMVELEKALAFVHTQPKGKLTDKVVIDGQLYMVKTNLNDISLGEMASIKTYQDNGQGDIAKFLPQMMAILIRPAKKIVKTKVEMHGETLTEVETEVWVMEKFDTATLDTRVQLFLKHLNVDLTAALLNFFFSTSKS